MADCVGLIPIGTLRMWESGSVQGSRHSCPVWGEEAATRIDWDNESEWKMQYDLSFSVLLLAREESASGVYRYSKSKEDLPTRERYRESHIIAMNTHFFLLLLFFSFRSEIWVPQNGCRDIPHGTQGKSAQGWLPMIVWSSEADYLQHKVLDVISSPCCNAGDTWQTRTTLFRFFFVCS